MKYGDPRQRQKLKVGYFSLFGVTLDFRISFTSVINGFCGIEGRDKIFTMTSIQFHIVLPLRILNRQFFHVRRCHSELKIIQHLLWYWLLFSINKMMILTFYWENNIFSDILYSGHSFNFLQTTFLDENFR